MTTLSIAGIGAIGGFGTGVAALRTALKSPPGPNGQIEVSTPQGPLTYPAYRCDPSELVRFVPKRKLRRVGRFSRLAVLAAALAAEDAGLEIPLRSERVGVAIATGYGALATTFRFLDTMLDEDDLPSPTTFSNSVHSVAASDVTIFLQCHGPSLTVSQFEMSFVSALLNARRWLADGRVDTVLLGVVEEIEDVLAYCRHCFFAEGNRGPIRPDRFETDSAVVGEGAAFLVLRAEGDTGPYGRIDAVEWIEPEGELPPQSESLVLGADGHRCCGRHYRPIVQAGREFTSFTPVYGSMPAGQGFDLAAAAAAMDEGLIGSPAWCVKADAEGQLGCVRLSR
jgi:3-oxoacyl-[acyl-carrier-protein] synthase II